MTNLFEMSKIMLTFVMLDYNAGTYRRPQNGRFFCPIKYDGDVLPCSVCNGSDGPGKGSSNGKGITVFYLMPVMLKNLPKMKNNSLVVSTKNPLSELITPDNLKKECKHLAMLLDSYSFNCVDKSIILEVYEAYVALENLIEKIKMNERKAA